MSKTKICNKCNIEKPLNSQFFYKRKDAIDGHRNDCKECSLIRRSKHYANNKEACLESSRKYHEKNKESISKRKKQYYKDNRDNAIAYQIQYRKDNKCKLVERRKDYYSKNRDTIIKDRKLYYEKNKEIILKYHKNYRERNKNSIIQAQRDYYKENREELLEKKKLYYMEDSIKIKLNGQKYISRKNELPCTLTLSEWDEIMAIFNDSCAYCGMTEEEHEVECKQTLHQDHFVPLSKGGYYVASNIIPSCRSCNCSKGNKDFSEWYPTHEYYSEERENKILEYLGYTDNAQQLSIL